ncbi:MAG: hypothetical protein SGI92_27190 [Bryobacteraceae bacterium]|nr:hypothetical protein [Bryobacteraceae bacterium]
MNQPLWIWCIFPSVAMSLGWMLRGTIGGGFLGAMIPGAMVALALCLLLKRETGAGLAAGLAAVGVGFGGQETYGQTVGLSLNAETYWWAILGFFLKGGVWGLLGGAVIGISFSKRLHKTSDLLVSFGLMIAGTYAGWRLVDRPKLMYFSDPLVKPREEMWFGLLVGALLLLVWLAIRSGAGARLPMQFALWGFVGGSAGFALGAAAQAWGRPNAPSFPFGWWKFMEMTFGALLGLAYGYCAWRNRSQIEPQPARSPAHATLPALAWGMLSIAIVVLLEPRLHVRFESTVAGALLLGIALYSEAFAWQTGITTTFCAFAIDLNRNRPILPPEYAWTLIALSTLAVAIFVARRPRALDTFLLLMWTGTLVALLKFHLPPSGNRESAVLEGVFVLYAVLSSLWAWRTALLLRAGSRHPDGQAQDGRE